MFGISELAVLLIVLVLVLGAKKLPELARSAGKAARILKSEAKAMKGDGKPEDPSGGDRPAPRIIRPAPGDATGSRPDDGDPR